jgi:hypothetical protein
MGFQCRDRVQCTVCKYLNDSAPESSYYCKYTLIERFFVGYIYSLLYSTVGVQVMRGCERRLEVPDNVWEESGVGINVYVH